MNTRITTAVTSADPLRRAVAVLGSVSALARACGVSPRAASRWMKSGLPRTEWTGETGHAEAIERATEVAGDVVRREELLAVPPVKKRAGSAQGPKSVAA